MITKEALVELIQHRVNGEMQAKSLGKFSKPKIAYYIGRAYNTLLNQVLTRGLSNLDPYIKTYTNVDILFDAPTKVYYSTLPANIILVPKMAGNGIVRIENMREDGIVYTPITNNQLQSIVGLEVDDIDDVIGYVFKNGRVEYQGITTIEGSSSVSVENYVRMELIVPFEAYDDVDIVQIPTGSDQMLLDMVVNYLMGTPDADNVNDNNSLNKNIMRNG